MDYSEFLDHKQRQSIESGFSVRKEDLNDHLFPFQKDIVAWSLKKGRSCIFADCGLGKTIIQLEFAHQVCSRTNGTALIIAPLSVAEQTKREGEKFGIDVTVCRDQIDIKRGMVNITNYEIISHFDPDSFNCVVLDESSILKSFTSTTRNELIDIFGKTEYKLCCTATPSPNDYMEMGNHSEFIGVMTRSEMLSTYFIHDGSDTSKWRLKGHGEKKFWEWVATWAICMRTPADLGYSDEGYRLPKLNIIEDIVESEASAYELFARRAETLSERREARKSSQDQRVQIAKTLTDNSSEQWLIWCDYNSESSQLRKSIQDSTEVVGADSPERKSEVAMMFTDGKVKNLISKPSIYGFGMNFQNCHNVIYCGISDSFESFYQSVRRCWRYGQKNTVNVHIIISERELNVLDNVKDKQRRMDEMQRNMIALMHDITMSDIRHTTRITTEYKPNERMEVPAWIA